MNKCFENILITLCMAIYWVVKLSVYANYQPNLYTPGQTCIGVHQAPLDLGVWWPYCPNKITQCPKAWVLFKRTRIAVQTKTFTILMYNETVIIPKIVILKPCILYELDRQPNNIRKLIKEKVIYCSYENFNKKVKTVLVKATTKTSWSSFA